MRRYLWLAVIGVSLCASAVRAQEAVPPGEPPANAPMVSSGTEPSERSARVSCQVLSQTGTVRLKESGGAEVTLRVPVSLHRPANAFRLYGWRPLTLHSRERRRDMYRDAFLELATRPLLTPTTNAWDSLSKQLEWLTGQNPNLLLNRGVTLSDLTKLPGEAGRLATDVTRQVSSIPGYQHLAALSRVMGTGEPRLPLAEPVAQVLSLRALATDEAERRLQSMGEAMRLDNPAVDPALRDGYRAARAEFDQVRQGLWPAVAATVQKNQGKLLLSAARQVVFSNLGIWALFGNLGWQGVEGALNAEQRGQYAVCLATVAAALEEASRSNPEHLSLALYAEYQLDRQLTEALRTDQVMPLKAAGGKEPGAWQIHLAGRCQELRAALVGISALTRAGASTDPGSGAPTPAAQ